MRFGTRIRTAAVAATIALAGTALAAGQTPAGSTFITQSAVQAPRVLEPDVLRERAVDLDLSLFSGVSLPERLRLELFADVSYTAVRDRVARNDGALTWMGTLEGVPLSTVVFSVVDGAVAGHVSSPFGEFVLEGDGAGGYVIRQVAPDAGPTPDDAVLPPADALPAPASPQSLLPTGAAADTAVVDVLVVYTTPAGARAGSTAEMHARIQTMVAMADAAYRASGTGGVRLVGPVENGFVASSDLQASLVNLQQPADGVMDEILAYRDQVGADVVTLITGNQNPNACGIGYIAPGLAEYAVNVVAYECLLSYTFAHEVGHNLGLWHDWFVSTSGGSAKGYVSTQGRFRTVMAYSDHCTALGLVCNRIGMFSDPDGSHQGFPTGVAAGTHQGCTVGNTNNPQCDADAVGTLAETAPVAAAYRFTDRLDAGNVLGPNQSIRAAGAACQLVYQGDGNLVATANGAAYWNSGTYNSTAGSASMQGDGNFVIYDAEGAPVWSSETWGNPGAFLIIQDDCNVVIYAADGATPLWYTGLP